MTLTLAAVIDEIERAYPPSLAEDWDAVGLVCGDPAEPADRILVCVDVTEKVVEAAVRGGAQLIVAHHPLLLRGVTSVAASTPKGRLIHALVRARCGLLSAHTNADKARPGVSDALADRIGLIDTAPLTAETADRLDKWVVMVPEGNAEQVSEAMFAAGAGAIGNYRECQWSVVGTGQFRPLAGASPAIGDIGAAARVDEARLEMVARRDLRTAVLAALRSAHPYEEPAFDVFEQAGVPTGLGLGRVGTLPAPQTLREFTDHLAAVLPRAPWGIRAAGDPHRRIERVAVCGGAGDSLIGAATAAGADAYVTADLRHHVVDESLRTGSPALIDAGHWATEFPWCAQVGALLADLGAQVTVFDEPTDPFTLHA